MSETSENVNVIPFRRRRRALSNRAALQFMREASGADGVIEVASIAELGRLLGWEKSRTWKAVRRWKRDHRVETETEADGGRIRIRVLPDRRDLERGKRGGNSTAGKRGKRGGKTPVEMVDIVSNPPATSDAYPITENSGNTPAKVDRAPPLAPPSAPPQRVDAVPDAERVRWRRAGGGGGGNFPALAHRNSTVLDVAARLTAVALAGSAAWFSINGMVVLFPGAGFPIVFMALVMESAKLIVAGWLGSRWRETFWLWGLLLGMFVLGLMSINAIGLYSQLVAAHVGRHGEIVAATETRDAEVAARIEVAAGRVADLDRRLAQIDQTVEGAAKKGRANTAVIVMQGQQKARAALVAERERAAQEVAKLKSERAAGVARGHAAEAEAAPIQYLAELFGVRRGGEEVIRWLIAAMVLCCDPLAVVLAVAIGARRRRAA